MFNVLRLLTHNKNKCETKTEFSYRVKEHGILVGPYGVTDDTTMHQKTGKASSFEEALKLEKPHTWQSYGEQRAARFYQFVEQFVCTRNECGDLQQGLDKLHSPVQFWSNREGLTQLGSRKIESVTVVESTHYFDGDTLALMRQLLLRTIDVSTQP